MVADYLITNFTTLMILLVLCVTIFTNRSIKIPAAHLFHVLIILILSISVLEYIESMMAGETNYIPQSFTLGEQISFRFLASTLLYILRPFVILAEVLVVEPDKKKRILFSIPAVINTLLYGVSYFTTHFLFSISEENHFQGAAFRSPLPFSVVYLVQFFYVIMLLIISMVHFKRENLNLSLILFTIVMLTFTIAYLEKNDLLNGYVTPVEAVCTLTYYTYLSTVYRQQLYAEMLQKEQQLAADKIALLRSQIQPHFIYNSLNIIRTLARIDKDRAVETIDHFSDYLKAHFRVIDSDDMISFETELENVKAFLALAEADHTRDIRVIYDLRETNFRIPQLSLEPIVENAVKYGIDEDGGTITISSYREGGNYIVRTKDSGNGPGGASEKESDRLAVGIVNTRKRLELLCNGRLVINITPEGTTADIVIPVTDGEHIQLNEIKHQKSV